MEEIQDYNESWVNFPRKITSYYRSDHISRGAYLTYLHLRINANAYGLTVTSLDSINSDVFKNRVTINSVNKYLLELKNQELIWFKDRRGSKGSFEILNDELYLPDGNITNLSKYFDEDSPEPKQSSSSINSEVKDKIQNSKTVKLTDVEVKNPDKKAVKFRTGNTDTETYKNINIGIPNKSKGYRCRHLTKGFTPSVYEERKILDIAQKLDEKCLDFMLKHLREGKFWAVEKAYDDYREISQTAKIDNPAAWFNTRLNNILKGKNSV